MAGFSEWLNQSKDRMSRPIDLFKGTAKKFGAEDGSLIAAAVSFYALLSLLPLLLLAVAVFGYIIGSSDKAFNAVVGFFNTFMPTSTFVVDTLRGLVAARGVIGWVGILALLWTGSQFFVTLQTAFDDIWEVGKKPGFIHSRIKAILIVIVSGVFLILSMASSSIISLLQNPHALGAPFLSNIVAGVLSVVAFAIGLAFAIALFAVVYRYVPDRAVSWRSALVGATFSGVAWVIAKELYRLYLTHFADFGKLYGSLGSVIILILWIYYSSIIMVFGAELAYVHEHGDREEPNQHAPN